MPGIYNIQVPVQPSAPISVLPADLAVLSKAPEICFPRPRWPGIQIRLKVSRAVQLQQKVGGVGERTSSTW